MPKKPKSKKGKSAKSKKKAPKTTKSVAQPPVSAKKIIKIKPVVCQSNRYPGILENAEEIEILASRQHTYTEICQLMAHGFQSRSRLLLLTPWGKYGIFRQFNGDMNIYYLSDACLCTVSILRHFDLSKGTAGLICFRTMHDVIEYILNSRFKREKYKTLSKTDSIEKLCDEFCTKGGPNLYKVCNKRGEITDCNDFIIKECKFPRCKRGSKNLIKTCKCNL